IRCLDQNTVRFDVQSSRDEEARDEEAERGGEQVAVKASPSKRPKKKMHHFEFDVRTQTLRELEDGEAPDDHPEWASVSPDGKTVVFARGHDLYMMASGDYTNN